MRRKLTKQVADALPKAGANEIVWDTEMPGFGLRVKPSGVRSWVIQYRTRGGRSRRLTLGRYGRLTPAEARDEARLLLGSVDRGQDPVRERREEAGSPTVAVLAESYLEKHLRPKRKPSTIYEFERVLAREILPTLGSIPVRELDREDVQRLHLKIGKRSKRTANYALTVLRAIVNFAEREGLREALSNPCRFVERFPERRRERFLSGAEWVRLGEVLAEAESEGRELPSAILAIRLLALTGMRRGEVLSLRWQGVDVERGVLTLEDSKTGRKTVPMSAPVRDLLSKAARTEGNPFVISGARHGAHLVGLQKIWERLRAQAGLEDVRLHDLRHSFASVGASAGLGLYVVGKILGHASQSTTQRYAHLAEDPVRAGNERIAGEIQGALEGRAGGDVVPIQDRRV